MPKALQGPKSWVSQNIIGKTPEEASIYAAQRLRSYTGSKRAAEYRILTSLAETPDAGTPAVAPPTRPAGVGNGRVPDVGTDVGRGQPSVGPSVPPTQDVQQPPAGNVPVAPTTGQTAPVNPPGVEGVGPNAGVGTPPQKPAGGSLGKEVTSRIHTEGGVKFDTHPDGTISMVGGPPTAEGTRTIFIDPTHAGKFTPQGKVLFNETPPRVGMQDANGSIDPASEAPYHYAPKIGTVPVVISPDGTPTVGPRILKITKPKKAKPNGTQAPETQQAETQGPQQPSVATAPAAPQAPPVDVAREWDEEYRDEHHPTFAELDEPARQQVTEAVEDGRMNLAAADEIYKGVLARQAEVRRANKDTFETRYTDAVKGQEFHKAIDLIAKEHPNPVYRAVATRLKPMLKHVNFQLRQKMMVSAPGYEHRESRGKAITYRDGSVEVLISSVSTNNPEVLLHESIHAATVYVLKINDRELTTTQRAAKRELEALYRDFSNSPPAGTDTYRYSKITEFVAYALSNPEMMSALKARPYQATNGWDAFKKILLKLLGIEAPKNQFDAVLATTDTLFRPPNRGEATKDMDVSAMPAESTSEDYALPGTAQTLAAVAARNEAYRRQLAPTYNGVFDFITQWLDKGRIRITDAKAGVSSKLAGEYTNTLRNSMGKLSPELLLRQAEGDRKIITSVFRDGDLQYSPLHGQWTSVRSEDGATAEKVMDELKKFATANNMSVQKAKEEAGRILEGERLWHIRDARLPIARHLKDPEIDALHAEYEQQQHLQEITRLMDATRAKLIDRMVQVGRIDAATGQQWKDVVGYVPFDREGDFDNFSTAFRQGRHVGRGLANLGRLPEIRGSLHRPVKNVFDNYLGVLGWMTQQTLRQDAVSKTLKEMTRLGFAKRLGGRPGPHGDRQVPTYENGTQVYYELQNAYDAMAFSFRALPLPGIVKTLGKASNILRTTVTAFPLFSAKQVATDVQRAFMYSGLPAWRMAELTKEVVANFASISAAELAGKGESHPIVRTLAKLGIAGQVDWMSDTPGATFMQEMGIDKQTLLKSKTLAKLVHKGDAISRASDLAVRYAIYNMTLKGTENRPGGPDFALATHRAREIINFQRRGAGFGGPLGGALDVLIQTVPFFNAMLQSMDVLYRAITGKNSMTGMSPAEARKMFASRALMFTAFAAGYAWLRGDDDEYKQTGLRKRDQAWLLGGGYALPVPTELGMLFKSIPETVWEYYRRKGTPEEQRASEAVSSYMKRAMETYVNPSIKLPQAVHPIVEVAFNHSSLTGRPLEGIHQQGMLPHMRENSTTSDFSKKVAKFAADKGVEISPISIDHLLNGYFGMTAGFTTMVVDAATNPNRVERPMNKIVGLAAFSYDPVGSRYLDEFYDIRDKVAQVHNTYLDLAKTDPEEALRLAENNKELMALNKYVNSTLQQLQKTRAYKNYLQSDMAAKELSPTERRKEIDEMRKIESETVSWLREVKRELRI